MLKTRVITALVLLGVLVMLLLAGNVALFVIASGTVFTCAVWEAMRLFKARHPVLIALVWGLLFAAIAFQYDLAKFSQSVFIDAPRDVFSQSQLIQLLMWLCALIWAVRLAPSLKLGLPPLGGAANSLLSGVYCLTILGCLLAVSAFFLQSPILLFSVLASVWIADIGAYFSGKAFGKRKLAPTISPGKSWEGAIGGWIAVLALSAACIFVPQLGETFAVQLQQRHGWFIFILSLSLIVVASVVGDLFESQLKRRANVKDSSALLPGHGGILDRIDALIPVLPIVLLLDTWH